MSEIQIIFRNGKYAFYLYGHWHEFNGYVEANVALKREVDWVFSNEI